MNHWKKIVPLAALATAAGIAACGSDADIASDNLSKKAEQFQIVRRIVGINGITDKVEFEITGRCSVETAGDLPGSLEVTCKEEGRDEDGKPLFSKHFVGLSDNMSYVVTQLEGANVSTTRTKVILKPEQIVPDFDLVTSGG